MSISPKIQVALPVFTISVVALLGVWQLLTTTSLYLSTAGQKIEKPTTFDFPEMAALLKQFTGNGLVDYAQLKRSDILTKAMQRLAETSPEKLANPKDKLAFWINAYNLSIIKLITDHYPISDRQQLGNGPSSSEFLVGGKPCSTQVMLFGYINPLVKTQSPKAVFLICGGALGYPPLPDHVLNGRTIDGDAEVATQAFVGDSRNVAFIEKENHFYLSPFFTWNASTVARDYPSVDDLVSAYLKPSLSVPFMKPGALRSYNKPFDWRINNWKRTG
jgi:hypothetical protein